jgi:hypothetical protein
MKKIDRHHTTLKLNSYRIFECNNSTDRKELKDELVKIDTMLEAVETLTDAEIINTINMFGYASIDMPIYCDL